MMGSIGLIIFLTVLIAELEFSPLSEEAKRDKRFIIRDMELECRRLMCDEKSRCVYRKNWCPSPPCPSMVFCGSQDYRNENPRMPSSCDKVRCSRSHRCVTRYVKDQRTGLYADINARCVISELRHREAATCAGFRCPSSDMACMLREPKCRGFPCRILRACIPEVEVKGLREQCDRVNCSSPDQCYIRRSSCSGNHCRHEAACLHTHGESLHDICRGLMCPRGDKCEPSFKHCDATTTAFGQKIRCEARAGCTLEGISRVLGSVE